MVFITATDTDAGKTRVMAEMAKELRRRRQAFLAVKPVACGEDGSGMNPDVKVLLKAQGFGVTEAGRINWITFRTPAAPFAASEAEGKAFSVGGLLSWCHQVSALHRLCLMEGVGGLMVPLTRNFLVADWIACMPNAEIWLVVRARLGGINHALLSLHKLCCMGRAPKVVIINDADGAGSGQLHDHAEALKGFLPKRCKMFLLPHAPEGFPNVRFQGLMDSLLQGV